MATELFSGPVDYVVFAFDRGADLNDGLQTLLQQVEDGTIEVLDMELITRDPATGTATGEALSGLAAFSAVDLEIFEGIESGILDEEDIATIATEIHDEQFALVVVYEDRSLAETAAAWTRAGGTEILTGGIAVADLELAVTEGQPS
ncbi:hypothetical protein [Acidipropionibacterium jensenii]|uniref:hypothetical protein n=1 Tax=Acidipropionibacterium jensenii TaxID=1749 RepID=UPI0026480990|nr:hypothetical protein [Acidipropionibacterium jensenii]MDN6427217.1 hypothetical protein [Acidipropionibacterium jensenii]MDN6479706.1 hypothetical protein [Acidipropionibacterium jensenii]MDN6513562.1 hypothetical protein [Acidipropionibacterium jensenii]MDN6659535.1 hypothetical protein [Acidipropionibacterium jensenii]MDN6762552.1 hypothetical protein [Acidipropionibacterium jensenii]